MSVWCVRRQSIRLMSAYLTYWWLLICLTYLLTYKYLIGSEGQYIWHQETDNWSVLEYLTYILTFQHCMLDWHTKKDLITSKGQYIWHTWLLVRVGIPDIPDYWWGQVGECLWSVWTASSSVPHSPSYSAVEPPLTSPMSAKSLTKFNQG